MNTADKSNLQQLRQIARRAMLERGLLPDFSAAALQQTNSITGPARDAGAAIRDLRGLLWASIDNDDSRDLDQLSVAQPLSAGAVKLLVAIADVDATVQRGSPIDDHARGNSTSVYTVAQIFPMLPEKLSTNLTSLGEGQERLVLGVLGALGVTRAQFVGHSYGGSLTLFLASRHPGLVRSMVLIDSAAPTYSDDRRSRVASIRPLDSLFVRLALTPRHIRGSLLASVYDPALVTPELVRAYVERLQVHGEDDAYYGLTARLSRPEAAGGASPASPSVAAGAAVAAVAAGKAAGGATANARAAGDVELETLALPALVVWGAEDRLIRVEAGRRAAHRLPAGEFVTIPRCGHLPMEERPAELLGLMVPFLRRHGDTAALAGARSMVPRGGG